MSYTVPAGEPRKPGEKLTGQGKPPGESGDKPESVDSNDNNNSSSSQAHSGEPIHVGSRRSAGAPKRPSGGKTDGKAGNRPQGKGSGTQGKSSGTQGKGSGTQGKGSGTQGKGSGTQGKGSGAHGKGSSKGHGKGHKGHVAPVKVAESRNWGTIAIFGVVGLLIVSIIGYSSWQAIQGSKTWEEKLASISGLKDFRKSNAKELAAGNGNHVPGKVEYFATPSVGGNHNPRWQNCMGDVYAQPIANEHATHSLEHGAVWITYDPAKVDADGVEELANRVQGNDYMLMSPYPGQPTAVSVQAWGYQIQADSPDDKRIDEFITAARLNASVEPGATCSGGVTATGTEPQQLPTG